MNKNILLEIKNLNAWFGAMQVLSNITMEVEKNKVIAIIGPSGCGKSTFIRCINRLHEEVHGSKTEGEILLNKQNIYSKEADPVLIRKNIGMVFQKPNPFPGMSIYDNVCVGLKLSGIRKRSLLDEKVESSLKNAGLWTEVKDHLKRSGTSLSGWTTAKALYCKSLSCQSFYYSNG